MSRAMAKMGPVVDFEDFGPGVEDVCLGAAGLGGAELREGLDAVHTDESLVEDHGVGDDRAGHAVGLDDIGHAEQPGDAGDYARPGLGELFENVGGAVDAFFEGVGGLLDGALGYRDEANEVGEVFDCSVEPAGLGEACLVGIEYAVGESGVGDGGREVVCVLYGFGVSQDDSGVDVAGGADDFKSEPAFGVDFGGVGGHELGFDDYWGAAGRGNEHVGLETGTVDDLLGVLVANVVFGQHTAKQVAEGVVGVPLDLLGHLGGSRVGLSGLYSPLGERGMRRRPAWTLWIPAPYRSTGQAFERGNDPRFHRDRLPASRNWLGVVDVAAGVELYAAAFEVEGRCGRRRCACS